MINVEEALEIIKSCTRTFGNEEVTLENSTGRILQQDWFADRDFPPFNRVTMDGIAINIESFNKGLRAFNIESIAPAGKPQVVLNNLNYCIEVMTGAVCPKNTNAIIRYEDVNIENNVATINIDAIRLNQNIHAQGKDRKKGELIISKNTLVSSAEIGVGASLGKERVMVKKLPNAMIISTGDELVDISETPLDHQIRKSNVFRIKSSLDKVGIPSDTSHLFDNKDEIREMLYKYLKVYDVIILSGGVSKGKFDFIPEVLKELGVNQKFHKVSQRPGKPFWFGTNDNCTIFALPGNPVSSFLCLQKYFFYWLNLCLRGVSPKNIYATLTSDVEFQPNLSYFLEVKLSYNNEGKCLANPVKGNGSGDLANLTRADAFIELPQGKNKYLMGEAYPIIKFR